MDPGLALHEAQIWLKDSTAEEMQLVSIYEKYAEKDPHAFQAMRYYKKNPSAKPFYNPFYWAVFTFTGVWWSLLSAILSDGPAGISTRAVGFYLHI